MSSVDLHVHSNHSDDGEFTIKQLIHLCAEKRMKMVSVTDHNSAAGVSEAMGSGAAHGIRVVSGIELDCIFGEENFHLLGYGFDHSKKSFLEIERDIYRQEMEAASEKIHKFKMATNVEIDEKEIFDAAGDAIITGELIGEMVLNREDAARYDILKPYLKGGAKSDMPYVNFYWDFFAKGKAAYVPIHYISLVEAKALIQQANGIAVLAHPGQNLKGAFASVDKIIREKIDGIEVFSSYHSDDAIQFFRDKAKEYALLATCGSDFHGKNKPRIEIGDCPLPVDENEVISLLMAAL